MNVFACARVLCITRALHVHVEVFGCMVRQKSYKLSCDRRVFPSTHSLHPYCTTASPGALTYTALSGHQEGVPFVWVLKVGEWAGGGGGGRESSRNNLKNQRLFHHKH